MKLFFIIFSLHAIASAPAAAPAGDLSDPIKIAEQWDDEEVYYQPKGSDLNSTLWNGTAYFYSLKQCFELSQAPKGKKVVAKKVECKKDFLAKASEPYQKFSDFKSYQQKLTSCLDKQDQKCLRPLISKTMQLSFGNDGFCDRRDRAFQIWKAEDYKKLSALIKKGVVSESDYKRFPPKPDDEGMGWRGHFVQSQGAWVLKSFVAGD